MSTTDNNFSTCANCGKEGNNLNTCNRCELVKYCNAACKKKHRSKHKKKCDRRVAELHDEKLFKQPPKQEDCPICFLRVPSLGKGTIFKSCCGKVICCGCIYAGANMDGNADQLCPFCRTPAPISDEENIKRVMKRVDMGDAIATYSLAGYYYEGMYGMPQDRNKALELWRQSAELGHAASFNNIGYAYDNGEGVERDEKKATHYYELAAIGGNERARRNLGCNDVLAGNYDRALKHFMVAVEGGYHGSLKMIQEMYKHGYATRDDYAKALKAYQAYLDEIKSDDRDKAAAFDGELYKYYE